MGRALLVFGTLKYLGEDLADLLDVPLAFLGTSSLLLIVHINNATGVNYKIRGVEHAPLTQMLGLTGSLQLVVSGTGHNIRSQFIDNLISKYRSHRAGRENIAANTQYIFRRYHPGTQPFGARQIRCIDIGYDNVGTLAQQAFSQMTADGAHTLNGDAYAF